MKQICINCKFMSFAGSTQSPDGEYLEHTGFCHRYPPVAAPGNNSDACPIEDQHYWLFPLVDLLDFSPDWCGEFQPKEDK